MAFGRPGKLILTWNSLKWSANNTHTHTRIIYAIIYKYIIALSVTSVVCLFGSTVHLTLSNSVQSVYSFSGLYYPLAFGCVQLIQKMCGRLKNRRRVRLEYLSLNPSLLIGVEDGVLSQMSYSCQITFSMGQSL